MFLKKNDGNPCIFFPLPPVSDGKKLFLPALSIVKTKTFLSS